MCQHEHSIGLFNDQMSEEAQLQISKIGYDETVEIHDGHSGRNQMVEQATESNPELVGIGRN